WIARQHVAHSYSFHPLLLSNASIEPLAKGIGVRVHASWNNDCEGRFSPYGIRNANDGTFCNLGMCGKYCFNIGWIYVLSSGQYHILLPVNDIKKTVFIQAANIAAAQP